MKDVLAWNKEKCITASTDTAGVILRNAEKGVVI